MGLFSKKSAPVENATENVTEKKIKKTVAKKKVAVVKAPSTRDLSWVIVKPRITEKAAVMSDKNIYVFDVRRDATKTDVAAAILMLFKVSPKRVTIVNQAHRITKRQRTNRWVTVPGAKKAHVTLKKGDTINIV